MSRWIRTEPRGIRQSRLRVAGGKDSMKARISCRGSAGKGCRAPGMGVRTPATRKASRSPRYSSEYKKFALKFTPTADSEDARLEIVGTGSGTFHVGAASLMPADNVRGFMPG